MGLGVRPFFLFLLRLDGCGFDAVLDIFGLYDFDEMVSRCFGNVFFTYSLGKHRRLQGLEILKMLRSRKFSTTANFSVMII